MPIVLPLSAAGRSHLGNLGYERYVTLRMAEAAVSRDLFRTIPFGAVLSLQPVDFQMILTIALYPYVAWLLARAQHYLLRPA